MRRTKFTILMVLLGLSSLCAYSQSTLTLEDCRSLAIQNNKQLSIARLGQDVAADKRSSARTKYLPRVDAMAGYELFSKEISILSEDSKTALNNLGTTVSGKLGASLGQTLTAMAQDGTISPEMAMKLGQHLGGLSSSLGQMGNELGQTLRQALRTNNRNMMAGSVLVSQPLYMGGSITAMNRMADINVDLASNAYDLALQNTLYEIEAAYWLVVSLRQKQKLSESFLSLVQKLDSDVKKLIAEGLATQADGLKVEVRVNEAEMTKLKVDDNLTLSKMLLCQLCGLPMGQSITLADEGKELDQLALPYVDPTTGAENRAELRMLQNAIDLSEQGSKLITAAFYRPQVALTGGYLISNPSVYNGFEHKFSGVWNIGVLVRMPLWSWNEGRYKLHAAKATTTIAEMERSELMEKINLQVEQNRFKTSESQRRLALARKHVASADENLRCANVGFKEGVMSLTDVTAAQAAWESAHTQEIDALIEIQLSHVGLKKALGQLK